MANFSEHFMSNLPLHLTWIVLDIQSSIVLIQQGLVDEIRDLEAQCDNFEAILTCLHRELQNAISRLEALNFEMRISGCELQQQKERVAALENKVREQDIKRSKQYAKIQSLESTTHNGTLIWRITDFFHKQQEAQEDRPTCLNSPAFYTSRRGYKLSVCLYLNGYGTGRGSHLSLVIGVMRNQHDDLLQWPFKQRIRFCLVNQNGGQHILSEIRPDAFRHSIQKPTPERNVAAGLPQFAPLTVVNDPQQGFAVDDTIFIQITVDTSNLVEPLADVGCS